MANRCYVVYKCFGHTNDIIELKQILDKLENGGHGYTIDDAIQGIIKAKNLEYDSSFDCRGIVEHVSINEKERYLAIVMDTAWCEQFGFRKFLEEIYKNMKVYYLEEEFCTDLYYTNDPFYHYFPDRYAIFFEGGEKTGYYYYKDIDSLIFGLEELTEIEFTKSRDIKGIEEFIEDYNNDEVNQDLYYSLTLHELTYVFD